MQLRNTIINTQADLEALAGTVEHAEFMQLLEGSLWLIQRDDINRRFVALEDNSVIARFGLTRADFPNAQPPELPTWTPPPSEVPQVVSPLQANIALIQSGQMADLAAYLNDPATDPLLRVAWDKASEFRRESPTVLAVADALGWGSSDLDTLFIEAAKIQA